jgi:hypothetical protein
MGVDKWSFFVGGWSFWAQRTRKFILFTLVDASIGHVRGSLGSFYLYGGSIYTTSISGDDFWVLRIKPDRCLVGYYASGTICQGCPLGKYSAFSNASFCLDCDGGTFTNTMTSSACQNCSIGLYSLSGSELCIGCPQGKYSTTDRASSCTSYAANKFSNSTGLSGGCSDCEIGKYSNASSSKCSSCPIGRYAASEGTSSCSSCPFKAQTLAEGSISPSSCVCPSEYWGKAASGEDCSLCAENVEGLTCPYNSPIPFVLTGYFRDTVQLSTVYRCIPQTACNVTGYELQARCAEGYSGFLCGDCVKGTHYRQGLNCKRCPNSAQKYCGLTLLILFVGAITGVLMFRKSSRLPAEIRYAFLAIQTLGLFPNISANWPSALATLFSVFSFSNLEIDLFAPGEDFSFSGFAY